LIYDTLSINEKGEFRRVCNKLLSLCLLCKQKEDTKKDYYFIERHGDAINEYFEPLGYELEINKSIKAVQLINKFGINRIQLKLIESITLLILRILYVEKMQELSLSQFITIEIDELQNRFIALGFKDKAMDKTLLRQALRTLKRFNIIETLDKDMTLSDSRIIVYPTIQMIVRGENINSIYEKECGVIYLGGYHNKVRQKLLSKIYEQNPSINYFHFGDIDAGGFKILVHLKKKTNIPFKSLNMEEETLKKYLNYSRELTPNDVIEINRLLENKDYLEYENVLKALLKYNKKLEQEIIF